MINKIVASLIGAAMLNGIGVADAADVARQTEVRMEAATPEQSRYVGPVALTDGQMEQVTAGFRIPLSPVFRGRQLVWDSKVAEYRIGAVLFAPLGGNTPAY